MAHDLCAPSCALPFSFLGRQMNYEIRPEQKSILVDKMTLADIEDIADYREKGRALICRCWLSSTVRTG